MMGALPRRASYLMPPRPAALTLLAAALLGLAAGAAAALALLAAAPGLLPWPPSAGPAEPAVARVYREAVGGVVAVAHRPYGPRAGQVAAPWTLFAAGFVLDDAGHVVTNSHVADQPGELGVLLGDDGEAFPAELLGRDPSSDLAILQVIAPRARLHPLRLGDSDAVRVGEPAIAIGSPFGYDRTVTAGVVSFVGRPRAAAGRAWQVELLQTDAAINPGSSGGPFLNARGDVIGVVSAGVFPGEARLRSGSVGLGFAVPANVLRQRLPEMLGGELRAQPWLGALARPVSAAEAEARGLPVEGGAMLTIVLLGQPADRAGLRGVFSPPLAGGEAEDAEVARGESAEEDSPRAAAGDVLTQIDGQRVLSPADVTSYLRGSGRRVGDVVRVEYWRGQTSQVVEVRLRARDAAYADSPAAL